MTLSTTVVLLLIGVSCGIMVAMVVNVVWYFAFGQDVDPRYLCLSDSPLLKQKCEQDEANKLRDLQMRVEIWNLLSCSERDICTPMTDNETGTSELCRGQILNESYCVPIAPQIQCDPDDEAFNITGYCDPDWNDSGIENQAYPASNMYACFDRADDFADFINNILHGDTTGYTVQFPCPPFQPPHQDDESGK